MERTNIINAVREACPLPTKREGIIDLVESINNDIASTFEALSMLTSRCNPILIQDIEKERERQNETCNPEIDLSCTLFNSLSNIKSDIIQLREAIIKIEHRVKL